ncbi:hypothetical protein HU200_024137 [Digitaria exilis]|uniref:Bifunctional inhibitor/plant lipid transfer protein/seed storage helical domain-containing protein n=1 Tax=Digitaria exilis TaxID=1010633 RepID=A0A835CB89_9POAL|nr:hypothetical protein HU200_024137 [Digitaria exilis]CAB3461132.1 unnamed protein product [Digitaria exilis]
MTAEHHHRRWAVAPVLVALITAALAVAQATPSSSSSSPTAAPGPAGGGIDQACMNSLLNMSDCLTYVTQGSTARRPDAPCCPELAGMVGSNPICLCELLSGAADSYGIAVDYGRALALPGICRVATPPVSTCTAMGYHVRVGPAAAPMAGMAPSPMTGMAPSGERPQFPGTSPLASPPSSTNNAARRFSAGGHLAALAMLPLAAAAVSGMIY